MCPYYIIYYMDNVSIMILSNTAIWSWWDNYLTRLVFLSIGSVSIANSTCCLCDISVVLLVPVPDLGLVCDLFIQSCSLPFIMSYKRWGGLDSDVCFFPFFYFDIGFSRKAARKLVATANRRYLGFFAILFLDLDLWFFGLSYS